MSEREIHYNMDLINMDIKKSRAKLKIDFALILAAIVFTYMFVISLHLDALSSSDPSAGSALGFIFILTVPASSILIIGSLSKFLVDFGLFQYEIACLKEIEESRSAVLDTNVYNRGRQFRRFLYSLVLSLILLSSCYLSPYIIFDFYGIDISDLMFFLSLGFLLPGVSYLLVSLDSIRIMFRHRKENNIP